MRAGQTAYKDVNGTTYQCALFPLSYMYCTQVAGPGNYSHCCGTATDWVGSSSRFPYYAPVDCTRVSVSGSDNIARYVSDNVVLTPSGLKRLAFLFMHDDAPPSATHYRQGDLIGRTGTAGFVTGDHVHLDQCFGSSISLTTDGTVCSAGNTCYYVDGGVTPPAAYFTTDETEVQLLGQSFTQLEDYIPGGGGGGDDPSSGDAAGLLWIAIGIASGKKKNYLKLGKG